MTGLGSGEFFEVDCRCHNRSLNKNIPCTLYFIVVCIFLQGTEAASVRSASASRAGTATRATVLRARRRATLQTGYDGCAESVRLTVCSLVVPPVLRGGAGERCRFLKHGILNRSNSSIFLETVQRSRRVRVRRVQVLPRREGRAIQRSDVRDLPRNMSIFDACSR